MSNSKRDDLVGAIGLAIMRWQDATEAFDELVGERYELGSAERRCLSLVSVEPQTPSAIAKETALTPAAVTTLVDRLEARGLVRRRHDTKDRRRVFVEATEKTRALIRKTYRHIAVAGAEMLAAYSLDELAIIRRFVEDALALQRRMTERFIKSAALTL